jgi:hypothetical protein
MVSFFFINLYNLLFNLPYIGRPCAVDGSFLEDPNTDPFLADGADATCTNPYAPFEDHLAFEWAHKHYVELQTSERQIGRGLDLWRAAYVKAGFSGTTPWKSAKELYDTIDTIQEGDAPWVTHTFHYHGPKPTAGVIP